MPSISRTCSGRVDDLAALTARDCSWQCIGAKEWLSSALWGPNSRDLDMFLRFAVVGAKGALDGGSGVGGLDEDNGLKCP